MLKASDYQVGERLTLVAHHGSEYPVEVVGHTTLPHDLVVRWLGLRPLGALSAVDGQSTICLKMVREVRRGGTAELREV